MHLRFTGLYSGLSMPLFSHLFSMLPPHHMYTYCLRYLPLWVGTMGGNVVQCLSDEHGHMGGRRLKSAWAVWEEEVPGSDSLHLGTACRWGVL